MRLDKFLSLNNYCKRSDARNYLKKHIVIINDLRIFDVSYNLKEEQDEISIDNQEINITNEIYYLLHKPKGYVTSTKDYHKVVMDLIPNKRRDLFPVGRLDIDTTGLLLITNNGALAHSLLSPKHHVQKTYEVHVDDYLSDEECIMLSKGILIDDKLTLPSVIKRVDDYYLLTIYEGRFHQVKRMFSYFGKTVISLKRISFGPLDLGDLPVGECRILTKDEIEKLKERTNY